MDKKVICFAGHSGAGKTTSCSMLEQSLDAEHIKGDLFFKQTPLLCPDDYNVVYGLQPDQNDMVKTLNIIRSGSKEKEKKYLDAVLPAVNRLLLESLAKFKDSGKEFLLLDWVNMAITPLWDLADYKVVVCGPKDKRHNALTARYSVMDTFREELGTKRDFVSSTAVEKAHTTANIMLYNNYDETFFEHIRAISQGIFQGKSAAKISQLLANTGKGFVKDLTQERKDSF